MMGATAQQILDECEKQRKSRVADMPTDVDALAAMHRAYQRLSDLGWRDAIYCPKDGTLFKAIEAGSTGTHKCVYRGEWPSGKWWIVDAGDLWPSRPILFKPEDTDNAR